MAIVKVYKDMLTGTTHAGAGAVAGQARTLIGFGRPRGGVSPSGRGSMGCGRILKVEFKGDDADVDVNNTLQLLDSRGRQLLAATAFDGGTDDSTVLNTEQEAVVGTTVTAASTVGVGFYLTPNETDVIDESGDFLANTEGSVLGGLAYSPVEVRLAAGTDGDWHRVTLFVEV